MRYLICLLLLFLSVPAYPSTWFAGTGNDGYTSDVHGIHSALGSHISDIAINNFIYENQSGTDIINSINALSSVINPGDILIWYYSGHASFMGDSNLDETAIGSTAADNYDETLGLFNQNDQISDDDLANAFASLSSTGVTLLTIFDTCYAGGFIGGLSDLDSISNLTFLGSSTESEQSYAYNSEPYSIFTTGLILGLENLNADSNDSGSLFSQEWFDYSYDYTTGMVVNQHPVFYGDSGLVIASAYSVPIPGSGFLLISGWLVFYLLPKSNFDNNFYKI